MCARVSRPEVLPEHRKWRRLHGLQFPLHPQQVAGWFVLLLFALAVFFVLIPALAAPLRPLLFTVLAALFILHLVSHVTALLLDPADTPLRKLSRVPVPEFDRTKHAHVIENGRCHLCNIQTSNVRTKHCSVCNKCVGRFDHHCKWLNHCIGGRNYLAFLVCVVSAVAACVVIVGVASTELVLYHVDRSWLNLPVTEPSSSSSEANFDPADLQIPLDDRIFLFIAGSVAVLSAVSAGLLLHLCLFHVYISLLGITTYEYIRSQTFRHPPTSTSAVPVDSIKRKGSSRESSRASLPQWTVEYSRPKHLGDTGCKWLCCNQKRNLDLETVPKESYSFQRTSSVDRKQCPSKKQRKPSDDEAPVKRTIERRPRRLSTFVVRRFLTRLISRGHPVATSSPVRRNQIRPSVQDKKHISFSADSSPSTESAPPARSVSLPALPPPTRRQIQSVSLKELGDVLAYVQQPKKQPSLRRHPLRRKSIPTLRPTMSPTLSPIHESGLSNPSTPQLTERPRPRPSSWLATDSYI